MTPATPQAAASHTRLEGSSPSNGQESSATQIGNVLVNVSTSETGSRVSAKNVPIRLKLPARLRIHKVRGRQKTKWTPALSARTPARRNARELRASAISCQSQKGTRA